MNAPSLKIGLWQGGGTNGNVNANLDDIERRTEEASRRGINLLVFPECYLTGYLSGRVAEIAGLVTDAVLSRLEHISRHYNVALVVGSYEQIDGGVANAAFVIDPERGRTTTYRKRMLFGSWEKAEFQPGTEPQCFSLNNVKIGVLICFDVEFPERVRELARLGVELVVVPTALMKPYDNIARHLIVARALENQVFVAYANRIGREGALEFLGQSIIVGPDGDTLVQFGEAEESLLDADIDISKIAEARQEFSYLDEQSKAASS